MKKQNKGFTLVELIVVIAILAILSIALIPLVNNLIDKSRVSRALSDLEAVKTACIAYSSDVGTLDSPGLGNGSSGAFPNTGFHSNIDNLGNWNDPYLDSSATLNPWGGGYGLGPAQVDSVTPPTNNAGIDFILQFLVADPAGQATSLQQQLLIDSVNLKRTGTENPTSKQARLSDSGDPNGNVTVLVISNIK